ncbi:MAG: DUF4340 domain-containing protein [Vulcanimicrobiota bacterium]
MNFKRTIIIGIIFILLTGGYTYYKRKYQPRIETEKQLETAVFDVKIENVNGMSFYKTEPDTEIVFEKKDNNWFITEPINTSGNRNVIETFIAAVATLKIEEEVEEKAEELAKYGLKEPVYEIALTTEGKKHEILLGARTVDLKYFYAKTPESPRVFLVSTAFKYNLDKNITDFRDLSVVNTPYKEIKRVILKDNNDRFTFQREDEAWTMSNPQIPRLDEQKVANYVRAILAMKVKDFIPNTPENRKKYQLQNPNTWIEIDTENQDNSTTVLLGDADQKKQLVYVLVEGEDEIYTLHLFEQNKFHWPDNDFMNTKPVTIKEDQLRYLQVINNGTKFVFEKTATAPAEKDDAETATPADWKMIEPGQNDTDSTAVQEIITTIQKPIVYDVKFPEKPLKDYGLESPWLTISGADENRNSLFELQIGGKYLESYYYCTVPGENTILIIEDKYIEKINQLK